MSKIECTDKTINPLKVKGGGYHCTKTSEGCANCYAERLNLRDGFYAWANGIPFDDRDVEFEVDLSVFDKLPKTVPKRVFVQSMGDMFHGRNNPVDNNIAIFQAISDNPIHTYIILTKRPKRMRIFMRGLMRYEGIVDWGIDPYDTVKWIPDNLHLGVTAENQACADERIPILLDTPAAIRFVSIEPMLGPVDISQYLYCSGDEYRTPYLDWIIAGGESGPGARPMSPYWAESIRDQCKTADVAFFFKQNGVWIPDYLELPGGSNQWRRQRGQYRWVGTGDESVCMFKESKKAAGRLLDGQEYNEYPEVE